jgi:hypothetical protein
MEQLFAFYKKKKKGGGKLPIEIKWSLPNSNQGWLWNVR